MDFEKAEMYADVESSSSASETSGFLANSRPPPTVSKSRRWCDFRSVLRLTLELVLASALLVLFASGSVHSPFERRQARRYGPQLPRKDVVLGNTAGFGPDGVDWNNEEMLYNRTEMGRIHHNWKELFPTGRGYVHLNDHEDFDVLHPPFEMVDVFDSGDHYDGHIMAVWHQLHCLSILMTSLGVSRDDWASMSVDKQHHRAHCVEYLRQSILCNGDTTVEGETGSWTDSTGWGQTHSCVDFDALTAWSNDRAIWDLREHTLPENFDFAHNKSKVEY